jgi:hypothetical protein
MIETAAKKVLSVATEDIYVLLRKGKIEDGLNNSHCISSIMYLNSMALPQDWRSDPTFLVLYLLLPNDKKETFKIERILKGKMVGSIATRFCLENNTYEEFLSEDANNPKNEVISPTPTPLENYLLVILEKYSKNYNYPLNINNLRKHLPLEGSYYLNTN